MWANCGLTVPPGSAYGPGLGGGGANARQHRGGGARVPARQRRPGPEHSHGGVRAAVGARSASGPRHRRLARHGSAACDRIRPEVCCVRCCCRGRWNRVLTRAGPAAVRRRTRGGLASGVANADAGATDAAATLRQFLPATPPAVRPPASPVHRIRLLLSHLGLLSWEPRGFRVAQLNRLSHKLYRDLKSLDRQHGYVRARQRSWRAPSCTSAACASSPLVMSSRRPGKIVCDRDVGLRGWQT